MNTVARLGLAAALLFGATGITIAEDAGSPNAGASAGANMAIDTTTTGGLGSNYGSLVSSLQSNAAVDLSAFNDSSTVVCVTVTSLRAEADANVQALDNAISQNQAKLTSLQASIEGNADLMNELKASCAMADLAADDVISVESSGSGTFTFYIDDRA